MEKRTRTEYSLLNMLTGVVGYVINTLLGFVCRMIFVRCLSESYLGINGLLTNFLGMLSLAELGIGSAIVYALYKPISENNQEKIASLMKIYRTAYYIIGIVVALAGIIMMPFLGYIVGDTSEIKENIYLIYGVYLFNTASGYFFSYKCSLITAYQKNYIVVGISYLITSMQSIIQIAALLSFKSYIPYLIIQTIGTQTYNIIISIIANKNYPFIKSKNIKPLPKSEIKKLFKNVKSVTVYKLSGVLVNNTDNLVITYFSGLGITGLASNYTLLVNTLDVLIKQLFGAATASVGNLNASADIKHQYSFFKALNLSNFWLYSWAFLGISFVSSDIVSLCFGDNYLFDWEIPLMLGINLYMVGMQNAIWMFKNTKGMFKYGQYILFFTSALNIIGDIIFGQLLGIFGIFLATAIARLFTNIWYEPYALFKVGFKKSPILYFKTYLKYLVLLFVEYCLCYCVCSYININPIINTIIKIIVCSVISNLVFIIVFRKKDEFNYIRQIVFKAKSMFLGIFNKLRRKRNV